MSELYKRHNYTNKYTELIIGNDIYEYDIRSAGFNLIKHYKLLDKDKIDYLETLSKKKRQIQIGLLCRSDKALRDNLNEAFIAIRKLFFQANNIEDDDVLSIKKDAIFVLKPCFNTEFNEIEFVNKNKYTSFLYIDRKEVYASKEVLHVKGIHDEKIALHAKGMCEILYETLMLLETLNEKLLREFLVTVTDLYKRRELPIEYYREFTSESYYRYIDKEGIFFETINDVNMVDIRYNYLNILVALQNILI